jgi:hypothetical protein
MEKPGKFPEFVDLRKWWAHFDSGAWVRRCGVLDGTGKLLTNIDACPELEWTQLRTFCVDNVLLHHGRDDHIA